MPEELNPSTVEAAEKAPNEKSNSSKWKVQDPVLWSVSAPDAELVLVSGERLKELPKVVRRYDFFVRGGRSIRKLECIGTFSQVQVDEGLIRARSHPVYPVAVAANDRPNPEKIRALSLGDVGKRMRAVLVNGWEVEGTLESVEQWHVVIQARPGCAAHLYRHAIVDYQLAKDASSTPEFAPFSLPEPPPPGADSPVAKKKKKKKRGGQAVQVNETAGASALKFWEELPKEVARDMVNAKLKIVLRELPKGRREVGDLIWFPLVNQPQSVPGNVPLPQTPLDLVITKKVWSTAQKKAEELAAQSTLPPLYVIEALIGLHQGRFAAVATGIQVSEQKPKPPKPTKTA